MTSLCTHKIWRDDPFGHQPEPTKEEINKFRLFRCSICKLWMSLLPNGATVPGPDHPWRSKINMKEARGAMARAALNNTRSCATCASNEDWRCTRCKGFAGKSIRVCSQAYCDNYIEKPGLFKSSSAEMMFIDGREIEEDASSTMCSKRGGCP